jgi:hypothetical protein
MSKAKELYRHEEFEDVEETKEAEDDTNKPAEEDGFFVGVNSEGTCMKLTPSFVHANFPEAFIKIVVSYGKYKQPKFFPIPPGAPRTVGNHEMLDERFPIVKYMQQGESTCLFSSFASALHYIGLKETAAEIASEASEWSANQVGGIFNWNALLHLMKRSCAWLQPRKIKGNMFDVLKDASEYPTLLQLKAKDGGIQHAITVVGGLIFDSNCERAIPLNKKSLDYCCSTDNQQGCYQQVYHGYRFVEEPTKKIKIWEKLKWVHKTNFFMDMVDVDDKEDDDL